MSKKQNSALLQELIEAAKGVGQKKNPPFTEERFVVALMNKIEETPEREMGVELKSARKYLEEHATDIAALKNALMAYIDDPKTQAFLDDLHMKKKMQDAENFAERLNIHSVDCLALLICLTREPKEPLKNFWKPDPLDELEGETPQVPTGEALTDVSGEGAVRPSIEELLAALDEPKEEVPEEPVIVERIVETTPKKPSPAELRARLEENRRKSAQATKNQVDELVNQVKSIRTELHQAIYGQDNAINVFATGYFQARMLTMMDKNRTRPCATFLFAGPPGVGKTFLAEKAAAALKLPFMRFDMSEYADKEANIEFCGSDKVYKNAKSGNVTSFVAENPKCVLLFDEIEKAHLCVIHLFLQMLDAGRLRDNYTDEEVSFKDAVIILTTNAGKQLYEEYESGDLSGVSRKVIIKALQKDVNPISGAPYFPGAICSRFASGNVVMFNHIGANNLRFIARKEIERHAENFSKRTGIGVTVDERVYTALLFAEGSAADARTIRSRAETFFNDELYELLRMISSDKVKTDIATIEQLHIGLDLEDAKPEIKAFFAPPEKPRVLVLAGPETVELCEEKASAVTVLGVQTPEEGVELLKKGNIDFVMLDMKFGAPAASLASLNLEDVASPARTFFKILREQKKDLPVYLLESSGAVLNEEERVSFSRQGVRGVLRLPKGKETAFTKNVEAIASDLYQQANMVRLAKENKLISFETAQSISKNGKKAQINLFDFALAVAVDSEDSKNVLSNISRPNVHFEDVIGAQDAKRELAYFVEYLKDPKKYMGTGVKAPKGVLLYGPPGTGKTMLAKAMACEAGVTFLAAEGNQFLKKYVGEGSEMVHKLFKTARKYAPAILFIDEIDAIAKERRGAAQNGGNGEETLTAFLTEMDGFVSDPTKPVFVLAATNFDVEPGGSKSLDPALMRRFDRRVYIDLPKKGDRIRFLEKKIAANPALEITPVQIDNIAMRATGMSLAELDSVVELALRSAIREGSTVVTDAILEEAFETFNSGDVKKWDASQLERVARHEAGHALLCWLGGETPSYLTVVARGNHGGYMQRAEQEGKAIYTLDELLARIRTSLGGRAAELVYYGKRDGISTGASGDLASATRVARQLVCHYGMDDSFGLAVLEGEPTAEAMKAINRILNEQMAESVRLVEENKAIIDALVDALLNKNHLNAAEIAAILKEEK